MSDNVINLTPALLRRIINEEKQILDEKRARAKKKARAACKSPSGIPADISKTAKQTREVPAKDLASTVPEAVAHYKKLKETAARLAQQLSEINEASQELRAQILEQL